MTANTNENKAKFFALYYYQMVLCTDENTTICNMGEKWFCAEMPEYFLELTPLSDISDEDAIEVAKIQGRNVVLNDTEGESLENAHIGRTIVDEYDNGDDWELVLKSFDFLRSKSYALPWMDLTIEDLQNYGWVKLKNK